MMTDDSICEMNKAENTKKYDGTQRLNELALFTGVGGGLLGTRLLGWRPVCGVEIDPYCREILLRRQEEGHLEPFPVWDDVRTFDGLPWRGTVDIVTSGDPCQRNSNAFRNGKPSESLANQAVRIISEVQPAGVIRENPSKVRKDAPSNADWFATQLESLGYTAEIVSVRACCMGYDHQRERLFVLAWLANAHGEYVEIGKAQQSTQGQIPPTTRRILVENRKSDHTGRNGMDDGMANRMDRLRAIGNGQVPAVVAAAWRLLNWTCVS